jgi:hypothetical protein
MTARIGSMSIDGTPVSEADVARIEAEERLHADQQRSAVRVVAGCSRDADDCRRLLSILGLQHEAVVAARGARCAAARAGGRRPRKGRAA